MSKWEKAALCNLCKVSIGKTPARNNSSYWKDGIHDWMTITDISEKYLHSTKEKITDRAVYECNMQAIPAGTVVMSFKLSLGKVGITQKSMFSNEAIASFLITDKKKLSENFLYYALRSLRFENVDRAAKGVTLNKTKLNNLVIPVPPLRVQQQIANELDIVSELLELRKRQLKELNQLIKSVFYEMFGNPIMNNQDWEKKSISEICTINPRRTELGALADDTLVTFVPMNNVSETGEIDTSQTREYHEVKTGYTYFRENDVLFAKITPCMENGKGAVARNLSNGIGFGSTEFHVLRPIEDLTDSEWLYRLTSLPVFRTHAEMNMTGSAGQKRVPVSFFDQFKVGLPPLELQQKYANIVNQIESQKSLVRQSIDETQRLFDSLMSKYFDD